MRDFVDGTARAVHDFFFGSSVSMGVLTNIDYQKVIFWAFIVLMAKLVILSVLRNNPGKRLIVHFAVAVVFFIIANMFPSREILLVSQVVLFLTAVTGLYYFLLWLPIRFQYKPDADAKIQELLTKGALTEEENQMLYELRRQSAEAYKNNVEWLFKPGKVRPPQ